jgi:hypothetical protein
MRDRCWYQFSDAKFNSEYLALYLLRIKSYRNYFKAASIITSLVGIGGWLKFAEFNPVWAILILAVQAVYLANEHLLPNSPSIENLQSTLHFYFRQTNRFEELWYKIQSESLASKIAEKHFKEMISDEEVMIKHYFQNKIPTKSKLYKIAMENTDTFISRYN